MSTKSLQDTYAAQNTCFGCGPANEKGLRIKSFVEGDEVVLRWTAEKHHEAFAGTLNGGVCGCLFDCHGNWTAAQYLMGRKESHALPSTVTAEFHVKLLRPTSTQGEITVRARVVEQESSDRKAVVEMTMEAGGRETALRAYFRAVAERHPSVADA